MDIRPDYANVEGPDGLIQVDPGGGGGGRRHRRQARRAGAPGRRGAGGHAPCWTPPPSPGNPCPGRWRPGDTVISGCINQTGLLRVRVTKALWGIHGGQDPGAGGERQRARRPRPRTSSPNSPGTTPPWWSSARRCWPCCRPSSWAAAWAELAPPGLIFLVISCPCALVISVPLSFFGGIGGASRQGILVKGGNYLEALAKTGHRGVRQDRHPDPGQLPRDRNPSREDGGGRSCSSWPPWRRAIPTIPFPCP